MKHPSSALGFAIVLAQLLLLFGRSEEPRRSAPGFRINIGRPEPRTTPLDEDERRELLDGFVVETNAYSRINRQKASPVVPIEPDLPATGVSQLWNILGREDYVYVYNSLLGVVGDERNVEFERADGTTSLKFTTGAEARIDDATGEILVPTDLPDVSDAELIEITLQRLMMSGEIARLKEMAKSGTAAFVAEIRLSEVVRIADKAFVAWDTKRAGNRPTPFQYIFWVDVRTRTIVHDSRLFFENWSLPAAAKERLEEAMSKTNQISRP